MFMCTDGIREEVADRMLSFWRFFKEHAAASASALSIRDLLAWVSLASCLAQLGHKFDVCSPSLHDMDWLLQILLV